MLSDDDVLTFENQNISEVQIKTEVNDDKENKSDAMILNSSLNSSSVAGLELAQDSGEKSILSEEKMSDDAEYLSTVLIQAEDFGGSLALPHYGFRRPSADYFNSNLMLHNFVISDITGTRNNVYFYDERGQGKGADALCSIRMRYHLRKIREYHSQGVEPQLSLSLLDNCVGQNKSHVVMQFMCLLSVLFYKVVGLMYFLPGHSHMIPDRVVGSCKRAIKGLNLFTPTQIVEQCRRVKGVFPEYLQGNDSDKPFRVNWGVKLAKYFKSLPSGYKANFFFEFSNGYVVYRRLASSPDEEALSHKMIDITDEIRSAILLDFFGVREVSKLALRHLTLPDNPGRKLKETKLKSVSKKYFSIPKMYLNYYPKYKGNDKSDADQKSVVKNNRKRKRNSQNSVKKLKRKVGRPKKLPSPITGMKSLTKYFRLE